MQLKRKMDSKATSDSGLLKSIVLSGLCLIVTVVGMSLWTLREDWLTTVHQTQESAMNLALSQSRQAEDTFFADRAVAAPGAAGLANSTGNAHSRR